MKIIGKKMFDFEYTGNLHIHSRHSDGGMSTREIAELASLAGLDFICINDHEYMRDSFDLGEEGFYGNLLVLTGLEIGKRFHHYLAYGIEEMVNSEGIGPQEVIDRVNEKGGFGFLAHPFEKGMPYREKSVAYTWNDLSVKGFTGLSIWNFSSRWKERVKTIFHGIFFLAFKSQMLKGPSRETISFWDGLNRTRRVVAIGTSDAHGAEFRIGPIRFIPLTYDFLFNTINVHVLIRRKIHGDFSTAKTDIYDALKEGRLFIAHDSLCASKGFRFFFLSDDGSDLVMGEEGKFHTGSIIVELPESGETRIYKDGIVAGRWRSSEVVYPVKEKGVYRVEVYRHLPVFGWRPWIFTNPIYLR
ncbi:MAG: PHP domain-containing protein [Deltaproteobacteria bacterium]|nr:PHP domain-containing protein [Deltaproteobacteria bacterium]